MSAEQEGAEVAADLFAAAFLKVLKDRLQLVSSLTFDSHGGVLLTNSLLYKDPDTHDQQVITSSTCSFRIRLPLVSPIIEPL